MRKSKENNNNTHRNLKQLRNYANQKLEEALPSSKTVTKKTPNMAANQNSLTQKFNVNKLGNKSEMRTNRVMKYTKSKDNFANTNKRQKTGV